MTGRGGGSGSSVDSLMLAGVKIITLASSMVNTMILSHSLSLGAYGTYAQGVLLVTVCSDGTVLGLADAVNYFFNRGGRWGSARDYVRTIALLQTVIGLATAAALFLLRGAVGDYFDNPLLPGLVLLLAFRPMLTNMTAVLQVLIVSVGRARAIAVRNLMFSVLKLCAVMVTALVTSSIAGLFVMLLALDVLSVAWFWDCFRRWHYMILPSPPNLLRIKEVLSFSLPMGVYVMSASLMRQVGALVIGMNEPTERYAVYANATLVLPLDVVVSSFLTVIIPIVTRYLGSGRKDKVRVLFRHYLAIGYLTTVTLGVACFVVSPELIQVLYGARYLDGLGVFRLYLVSTMVRFAGLSLILSAAGRTRALMLVSLGAVAASVALCPLLYAWVGFTGPAVASVAVTLGMTGTLLGMSLGEIDCRLATVFDFGGLLRYGVTVLLAVVIGYVVRRALIMGGLPVLAVAAAVMLVMCALMLLLNRRSLASSLRAINSMK